MWLVIGSLQLILLVPLVNVPVPAQVNEISKGLARYVRIDFIELFGRNQTLNDFITQYIFDF